MIIAAVPACDRSTWPSNQAQMVRIFEQQKATFVGLEQEMAADGLLRMSPGVFSEMARNPTIPKLPSSQADKYLTRFIHSAQDNTLPKCVLTKDQSACGTCSIELEQDWLLEYSRFPANPDEETRQC